MNSEQLLYDVLMENRNLGMHNEHLTAEINRLKGGMRQPAVQFDRYAIDDDFEFDTLEKAICHASANMGGRSNVNVYGITKLGQVCAVTKSVPVK